MRKFIKTVVLLVGFLIPMVSCGKSDVEAFKEYMSAAMEAMDNNNTTEAITQLEKAHNAYPNNFLPLYLIGHIYVDKNDYKQASKYFEKALIIIDDNEDEMIKMYKEFDGTDATHISFRKIMTEIYNELASYYRNFDQLEDAKKYYKKIVNLNIESGYIVPVANSLSGIYQCYREENNYIDCFNYFSTLQMHLPHLKQWEPCKALIHAIKGDCYYNVGQQDDAIIEYKLAATLGHTGAMEVLNNSGIDY